MAYFYEQFPYFFLFSWLGSIIVAIYIVNCPIIPEYKIAWIVPVLAFPFFGIPLYFLLGRKHFGKENSIFYNKSIDETRPLLVQNEEVLLKSKGEDYFVNQIANYVYTSSKSALSYGGEVKYYSNGESMYEAMINELKQAEKFIFMEYFIFKPGKMLDSILNILEQKVKDGIEVRLMLDDFGCTFKMPHSMYKKIIKMGIKLLKYEPLLPFINSKMNNRDHRKLLIVDGQVAFTGGINISDEYINETHPFGYWKDSGIRVTGGSVKDMTITFMQMWNSQVKNSDRIVDFQSYLPSYIPTTNIYSLFINDSPHDDINVNENCYLKMIEQARKYVYITTPYLIIDHDMTNSLVMAANSGIDVRIIIPGIPDKKQVYELTKAFAQNLVRKNVKVYRYKKGFIHSKSFVVDDLYSIVGTANLDYRSLYLHFECGLFVRDKQFAYSVKEDYERTLQDCEELTPKLLRVNIFTRGWRALLRMFAPLM